MRQERRLYQTLLLLILVLAVGLRLYGLTWGEGHGFHVDERYLVRLSMEVRGQIASGQWPRSPASSWGKLPLYLLAVSSVVADGAVGLLGRTAGVPSLYVGRLLAVLLGVLSVVIVYALGRDLFSQKTGLLAALFLAISVLAVQTAHFYTVDSLLLTLTLLALWIGVHIGRRNGTLAYVAFGIVLGMALATKVSALLLLLPLLVAHLWRWLRAPYGSSAGGFALPAVHDRPLGDALVELLLNVPRLLLALLLGAVVFLILDPYPLLAPVEYFSLTRNDSIVVQSLVVRGAIRPLYTLSFTGTSPFLYYLVNLLPWAMGWPLLALGFLGVLYSLYRVLQGDSADIYLLTWTLAYFLIAGGAYVKFIRYALPLVPPLCILAARLLVALWREAAARWPSGKFLVAILGTTVAGYTLLYALAFTFGVYGAEDTPMAALRWLEAEAPEGAALLVEKDESLRFHALEREFGIQRWHVLVFNPYNIGGATAPLYQAPPVPVEDKARYLAELRAQADYVVISDSWMTRFRRLPQAFPAEARHYKALFDGTAGFQLAATFRRWPHLGGLSWDDRSAELTFRLFDHPLVYIFERK
ncbi:MAG TPA: phospholipid carrier-dependent glycosyltransferase [Anaerolineae bacterium]|nr:phospholipid carrier-dependent glycosyltransferase [Anaerolineae bacterium]